MQKLSLYILLVAASFILNAQENIEQKIRDLEQQEVQAVLSHDIKVLERIWNPDIMVNNPYNIVILKNDEIFDRIDSGVINYSSFSREIEEIKIFEDFVVTMGHETIVHKTSNLKQTRRFTNLWREFDGEWKIFVRHANIVCE